MRHAWLGTDVVFGAIVCFAMSLIAPFAAADCPNPRPPEAIPAPIGYASFGYALEADGTTLVLADRNADPQGLGTSPPPGAVVVMRRHDGQWQIEAELTQPLSVNNRSFGATVSLQGDRIVVDGQVLIPSVGIAPVIYLFERREQNGITGWPLVSTYVLQRPTSGFCGWSEGQSRLWGDRIAFISTDSRCTGRILRIDSGPTIEIIEESDLPLPSMVSNQPTDRLLYQGDIIVQGPRIYRQTAGVWGLETTLSGKTDAFRVGFGACVSLDGDLLAIGANAEPSGLAIGYAQVYRRTIAGTWELEAEFEHPNERDPGRNPGFGIGVSIKGSRLAISAHKDDFAGTDAGAVFLYQRGDDGVWRPQGSFTPGDATGAWTGWELQVTDTEVIASAIGYQGLGGAFVFDACTISGGPGSGTPRCLPGILGLLTYIEAFITGDPFADFDRSGSISVQDLFDFLNAWFAGCP